METFMRQSESDLNDFFRAMGEISDIDNETETLSQQFTDFLVSTVQKELAEKLYIESHQQNPLIFDVFGSSAEHLKCSSPYDGGDIDVMIYSMAEGSIIDESIMEYDTRKPVFVRLRGKDHPVLQHCLAENSDYVTTSTLKEFHPQVFGSFASRVLNGIPKILANFHVFLPNQDGNVLENPRGPAFQWFTYVQPITEENSAFLDEQFNKLQDAWNLTSEQNPTSDHDVTDLIDTFLSCMSSSDDIRTSIKTTDGDNCSDFSNSTSSNEKENHDVVKINKTKEDEDTDSNACSRDDVQGRMVEQLKCLGATGGHGLNADKPTLTDEEKEDIPDKKQLTAENFVKSASFDVSGNVKVDHRENMQKVSRLDQIHTGLDLVPAFEVKGWPEIAGAWTTRSRLWPSNIVIYNILQSGYHLVVKTPKDSDKELDIDFRLSFSRAELILSGELNDIQRDCYRCFKMYYRFALQQREPKIITSYFFKTILLWTVEETGMEVWNDNNRGFCVMMLLKKLLKSLERKSLPQFFVPEFNLLEEAVVDFSQEVQELADEVKKIYENPMEYLLALIPPYQTNSDGNLSEKKLDSIEEPPAARKRRILRDLDDRTPGFIEHQDFQNVYQDVCRELVDWVVQGYSSNKPDDLVMKSIIANMHSFDISKTEDEMMEFLEDIYHQVSAFQSSRNPKQRIISGLKGMIEDLARGSAQADMSHDPHPLRDLFGMLKASMMKVKESTFTEEFMMTKVETAKKLLSETANELLSLFMSEEEKPLRNEDEEEEEDIPLD